MAKADDDSTSHLIEEAIKLAADAVLENNLSQRREMEERALRKLREVARRRAGC